MLHYSKPHESSGAEKYIKDGAMGVFSNDEFHALHIQFGQYLDKRLEKLENIVEEMRNERSTFSNYS